jgi:phage terminase large subunit-like protein
MAFKKGHPKYERHRDDGLDNPEYREKQAEVMSRMEREFPLMFLDMNDAQERFFRVRNRFGRVPLRRLFEAGNKEGKTYAGLAEDISYAVGYRCWLPEDDRDHKLNIRVPNIGLIGCETKIHSVAEKLEPALRMLVPKTCRPVFKPGPNGVLSSVILPYGVYGEKCGSRFYLRSYDERPETFEGIDFDWVHWDEPPPEKVFLAAERGKIVTNAPSWFTMTPLKEPWIYERFSSKAAVCV